MAYSPKLDKAWNTGRAGLAHLVPSRLVAIAAATIFSVTTLARTLEIPDKATWSPGGVASWILVSSGLLAGYVYVANTYRLGKRTRRSFLAEGCLQLAAYIDDECSKIKLRQVGVHLWEVGGPPFARRLYRGPEFILRERRHSHMTFTKGKGVLGKVWETGVEEAVNLEELQSGLHNEAAFNAAPAAVRLGLTWPEYERSKRYKSVWAAPLFKGGKVAAIVSVDIQASGVFDQLRKATTDAPSPELGTILKAFENALTE